jgi:hypothetical protein
MANCLPLSMVGNQTAQNAAGSVGSFASCIVGLSALTITQCGQRAMRSPKQKNKRALTILRECAIWFPPPLHHFKNQARTLRGLLKRQGGGE